MTATPDRILRQLKLADRQAAAEIGLACSVSAVRTHKHLQDLKVLGLVTSIDYIDGGPGRPKRLWSLTGRGHAQFPDEHGHLATQLIRHVASKLGARATSVLLAERQREMQASDDTLLREVKAPVRRLHRLAEIRTNEGFMARTERAGDSWLFIQDHCPILAAASSCPALCQVELDVLRRALGNTSQVERIEHRQAGGERCIYRVRLEHFVRAEMYHVESHAVGVEPPV